MAGRIASVFGGYIDREAIEVMMDEEIQRRIETAVTGIIGTYSDDELVLAKAEFQRQTKMSRVARKATKQ